MPYKEYNQDSFDNADGLDLNTENWYLQMELTEAEKRSYLMNSDARREYLEDR